MSGEINKGNKGVLTVFIVGVQLLLVFMYKFYFFDLWTDIYVYVICLCICYVDVYVDQWDHSFISGCLTKMTMISIGIHQKMVELVLRTNTFLSIHLFIPLKSCLKPILVVNCIKTINCYFPSISITSFLTFIR